jgi:hypothetical protein
MKGHTLFSKKKKLLKNACLRSKMPEPDAKRHAEQKQKDERTMLSASILEYQTHGNLSNSKRQQLTFSEKHLTDFSPARPRFML